ncbi:DNA mismatch repair protein MutS [Parabacteroides sp. OttesenSCG-928-G21]|nr:DNA mismatch repair protein MutS [Parabacteroides sp. OttesenSCG-928-G21]
MKNVYSFYNENCKAYSLRVDSLKKKIHSLGSIRLILVIIALFTIWFLRSEGWQTLTLTTAIFVIPFAFLMLYHNRLSIQKTYYELLLDLNQNELKGLAYDFSAFDGAPDKISPEHEFSLDLDLFGERSLFQSINRTVTSVGRTTLSDWFIHPLKKKTDIIGRQKAVQELAALPTLCQHFYVSGKQDPGKNKDKDILLALSSENYYFINNRFFKSLIYIIPSLWILLIIGCLAGLLNWNILAIYFPVSFLLAYMGNNKINKLHNSVNKMERIFRTYADLMKCIETQSFHAEELLQIQNKLSAHSSALSASHSIKQLSGYIGGLDQRGSFAGILLNVFYLRDIRHALLLEKWQQKHINIIPKWFEALAEFDAFCSLATFAFNHPDYTYAEIADHYFNIEGQGLGHPLIPRNVCVKNDIRIAQNPSFLIITGANMAGKSTYLRTIGVNFLLACIGAPACAEKLCLYPAQLVTSLRTSDSLVSNESYFFAELKRLKMIIDRLKSGEELFIILDEILKGTNSLDKQKGSIALMKQLVSFNASGIIATHDLQLGNLENEFPQAIKNYRFEADIKEDTLSFSYLLREGIAQNMNASFLMKKMGITV